MNKPKITVLMFGCKAQRGKDTACDYLISNLGFERFAFADKLKDTVADLYGFSKEQMHGDMKDVIDGRYGITPRQVLQDFGAEQRKRYPKIWADYVFRKIDADVQQYFCDLAPAPHFFYCISDFRFQNEYEVAYNWSLDTSKYDKALYTVKMLREGITGITNPNNISEIDLDHFNFWSFMINNNGTIPDLHKKVDYVLHCIDERPITFSQNTIV